MATDSQRFSSVALGTVALLIALLAFVAHPPSVAPKPGSVKLVRSGGYVGSDACFSCHPDEHSSWARTFHSTMTRTIAALFDGSSPHDAPSFPVELELDGVSWKLVRQGETLSVIGPDLHEYGSALARARSTGRAVHSAKLLSSLPVVERRLVLVTGSHHYLAFWAEKGSQRELRQLPFVYRLGEERWLPRREAFLQPADAEEHVSRFNANCIQCHTVAGRPQQSEGQDPLTGEFWERFDSEVADLGISCEACHGPAGEHVRSLSDPWTRHDARHSSTAQRADRMGSLFVPSPDSPAESTLVCAQCHSYFLPESPDEWWQHGFSRVFRPGDSDDPSRRLLTRELLTDAGEGKAAPAFSGRATSVYWSNGSIMVGGREANGLLESPCSVSDGSLPQLTCVHCHSMHEGPPSGQVSPHFESPNAMCTQCHELAPSHSGHAPGSSGGRCISCHMPATSYALLSGVVSHKILIPPALSPPARVAEREKEDSTQLAEAPHPCMLCHTDRSRHWVARARRELWPSKKGAATDAALGDPSLDDQTSTEGRVPWSVHRALSGNAAVRAVVLWAMSSPEALSTGGPEPLDAVLPRLARDDVAAIRHIAGRALERRQDWIRQGGNAALPASRGSSLDLKDTWLDQRFEGRDRTPMTISE